MAGRVNTKFVIMLVVVLAYMGTSDTDPAEHVARGDAAMEAGQPDRAVRWYRRAMSGDPSNPAIVMKYCGAIERLTVQSDHDLRGWLRQLQEMWKRVVDNAPDSPQAMQARKALLRFQYDRAETFPTILAWDRLYEEAATMLGEPLDQEAETLARKFRGIAQTQRMLRREIEEQERQQAREDLAGARQIDPDDPLLNYCVALWHLYEAKYQRRLGKPDQAKVLEADARTMFDALVTDHPDQFEAVVYRLRGLVQTGQPEAIMDQLEGIETLALEQASISHLLEVATLLEAADRRDGPDPENPRVWMGRHRAEQLLRAYWQKHPDSLPAMVELATNLIRQERDAAAEPILREAIEDRSAPVAISSLQSSANKEIAMAELTTILMKQGKLEEAEAMIARLRGIAPQASGHPERLEGKLALLRGQYEQAEQKLNAANTKFEGQNAEVVILQGQVLWKLGEIGAARQRLAEGIKLQRGRYYWPAYHDLITICLVLRDADEALQYAQMLLDLSPDDAEGLRLKATALTQQFIERRRRGNPSAERSLERALAILEPLSEREDLDAETRLRTDIQVGRVYRFAGQYDAARRALAPLVTDHADDEELIEELVRVELADGKKAAAIAWFDRGLEANPDRKVWSLAREKLRGASIAALTDQVEALLASEEDPIDRELALWRYHRRLGQSAEARAALARARAIDADDARVLEARLDDAIEQRDWTEARAVAEIAADADADLAQGMFWIGRVELERGRYTQAVATLSRGVNLRPRYSKGWQLLGEARRRDGDLPGADAALTRALELQPNNVDALRSQHLLHDARGRHQLALETLDQAMRFAPNDPTLQAEYLDYLTDHGDPEVARQRREAIARAIPGNQNNRRELARLYVKLGQDDRARELLQQLLAEQPNDLANVAVMAEYHLDRREIPAGRELLERHIAAAGEQAGVDEWLALARYLRLADLGEEAEQAYRKAIEREGTTQPASRELADWYFDLARYAEAVTLYARLAAAAPDEEVIERRLIEALVRSKQFPSADDRLDRYVQKYGHDAKTSLLEALIAQGLGGESGRERAERALDRAIELNPNHAAAYLIRARFRLSEAVNVPPQRIEADLRRAVELDPGLIEARELLIRWYLDPKRSDIQAAISELNGLKREKPKYVPARHQLATIFLEQQRYAELEGLLAESQRELPQMGLWHEFRARALVQQGQMKSALSELRRAHDLDGTTASLGAYAAALVMNDQPQAVLTLRGEHEAMFAESALLEAVTGRAMAMLDRRNEAMPHFERAVARLNVERHQTNAVVQHLQTVLSSEQIIALLERQVDGPNATAFEVMIVQMLLLQGDDAAARSRIDALRQRMASDDPLGHEVLRLAATVYKRVEAYDRAAEVYRTLLDIEGDDVETLNNYAYLLANHLGRPGDALPLAERAVELAPRAPLAQASILDTLGWVQFRSGALDQAELTLRKSLAIQPLAPVHLHLAEVLIAKHQAQAAEREIAAGERLAEENNDRESMERARTLRRRVGGTVSDGDPN